ncbi:MAG: AbrB/MazE/SpoVT family DNA-binding domain-containing protein [Deltaproteobacteria bacterium]|nr:MAG: AbrB/MazE/SpoVT family DNA-binding domain-containing protein [Deltaproteobacteria bacterium]
MIGSRSDDNLCLAPDFPQGLPLTIRKELFHNVRRSRRRRKIMPVALLTSKGQMTIPKEVREALNLKPSEKVVIIVDGDQAILKPIRGNLLDLGGSVRIPEQEKPIPFRKVRDKVRKAVAKRAANMR